MNNKLVKSSFLLITITILSKLLGLVREMVMANYLGTSAISDAYVLGTILSQIIITGLAGAFFKTYIPIATAERYKSHKKYVDYTAQLLYVGTGIFAVISCIFYATAQYTTYWLSSGASRDVINLAIGVCKATAFPSMFLLAVNVFQGYLHTQEKFLSNIIYPIVMNLTIIAGLIIGGGDINWLSSSYGCSIIFSAIALWAYSKKSGFSSISLNGSLSNFAVIKTFRLTIPLFIGGLVSEINEIIDRCFSAFYAEGVLTALRYGKLLEIFIVSAIGIAIGQAVYPKIAQLKYENKIAELEQLLSMIIIFFCFVCIPIFVGIAVIGKDLVSLIFLRGAFDYKSVEYTSVAFIIYSISILPVSFNEILSRVFFAYDDTKHPVLYSTVAMGTNIALNAVVVFGTKMDFYGLAMTTSICETMMAIFYIVGVRKRLKLRFSVSLNVVLSEIVCALIMGVGIYMIESVLPENVFLRIPVLTIIGLIIYIGGMYICNHAIINDLVHYLRRK